MLHSTQDRWPRVLLGERGALRKCLKCGVTFVSNRPAQQTCRKCTHMHAKRDVATKI